MLPLLPPARLSKFLMVWIVERGTEWDELPEPPSNSFVARWLGRYYQSRATTSFALDAWWEFCARSRRSGGLVLYAQRAFVNKWFGTFNHLGIQNLEDTNCPWDWDHIHAQNLIKRKWKIDVALREWHSSIGNLRIWPMELNRSDSDLLPSEKLSDPDSDGNPFFDQYELRESADILEASFISPQEGFAAIDEDCDIKSKGGAAMIRRAIQRRMLSLYQHWFYELRLSKYFPDRHESREGNH